MMTFMAYTILPFWWAYDSVILANRLQGMIINYQSSFIRRPSLAKLFWYYYGSRMDGANKVARMYYIMVGAVVWLLCQIIPFLASIVGALFWLFLIGLVVTSILGVA